MPRRAGVAWIILLLLWGLTAGACAPRTSPASVVSPSPAPPTGAAAPSPPTDPIRADLHRKIVDPLAKALAEGDEELLPPLEPDMPLGRNHIENAIRRSREFGVEKAHLADTRTSRLDRSGTVLQVEGFYRIKDIPEDLPWAASIHVDPVGANGWQVGAFSWNQAPMWSGEGQVRRTDTESALIFHPPAFDAHALGRLVTEARAELAGSLPEVRSNRYPVFVVPLVPDFQRLGGGGAATVVTWQTLRGREFEIVKPWLLVDHKYWEKATAESRRALVLHEMTHAILAPYTSPLVPDWLNEGIAVHFSKDPGLEVFRQEPKLMEESSLQEVAREVRLAHRSHKRGAVNYALAGAAVAHLAERFGDRAVLDFMESFITRASDEELEVIGTADKYAVHSRKVRDVWYALSDRLLLDSFGLDFGQLDAEAKDWIRRRL